MRACPEYELVLALSDSFLIIKHDVLALELLQIFMQASMAAVSNACPNTMLPGSVMVPRCEQQTAKHEQ